MTDFATNPEYSGNNLSLLLLRAMEEEMIIRKVKTVYTIARSYSKGMNITFAKQNYQYMGTLINNTNIAGNIENMNVWYKSI
jgi:putative beta-lysine N-acetyltransferase